MTRKNILMILPIMLSILLIPSIGISFAEHGHNEGGGGCNGDCTAPTLGKDNSGKVIVTGGFAINEQIFDAEHFEQTIPTQIVHVNEPVEITLKVYENSGPNYLQHVGMELGNEYIFDSYIWRHLPSAEIGWEQTFDGIQSVKVENTENIITDVSVEAKTDGPLTVLKFQFTPTMTFDSSLIKVKMWDQNRSYWLNNFHDALEIKSDPFTQKEVEEVILSTESEIQEETSEHSDETTVHEDEHESHNTTEEIHCSADSIAILDTRFGSTYCASNNFATALIESGLATII